MRKYCDDDNSIKRQRNEKPKRHAMRWLIYIFLVFCCCFAVFAFGLISNDFPFSIAQPFSKDQPSATDHSPTVEQSPITDQALVIEQPPDSQLPMRPANNSDSNASETNEAKSHTDDTEWCLVLVNKWNPIPDDYDVELKELANGQSVNTRIYPALQKMFDTARSEGAYPVVVAGYRTAGKQQSLLDAKIAAYKAEGYSAKEAKTKAEAWVAIPGTSEHQLGIAVDIGADETHSTDKEVEEWLKRNSYKFGFIWRYSADKSQITGVIDEPWHYRYVGVDAATEIYDQGICLEEYLGKTN